ncbi:hypothetical protein ASG12_15520 [Williamsia sp. Leaf354]|uniref:hypothetical protein n=1 Tax=Williamsia sp. Leaf354 TaxID=1736349 RepID=UPI0006FBB9EB|nr:hypothetical protein [Williamsia sp. Leaf354]KQR97348.1 hypothetical protein ASG12_15520 [Williamsia sp. Leaf354]
MIDIAFGAHPDALVDASRGGDAVVTGHDRWLHAVALGASGHYARALTELQRLRAATPAGPHSSALLSLVASTWASHLRQCGRHADARRLDGDALGLASAAPPGPLTTSAAADALVGLAADHLGLGAFDVAGRLLDRAVSGSADRDAVGTSDAGGDAHLWTWVHGDRLALRAAWVRTELCLYRGDPEGARRSADTAVAAVQGCPSVRHLLKTDVIEAATRATGGDIGGAVDLATDCVRRADRLGLDPLRWASAALLVGLSPHLDQPTSHWADEQEARARRTVNARGGQLQPAR